MDQETFNLSIRKFLKMVGVNSQREIEQADRQGARERQAQGGRERRRARHARDPLARGQSALRRGHQAKMNFR